MEPWVDEAAAALDRITRDPLADAVAGTVEIVALTAPAGHGRYRECAVELRAQGPGIASRTISSAVVFDTRRLPPVGTVLPARISPSHSEAVEVEWDALPR